MEKSNSVITLQEIIDNIKGLNININTVKLELSKVANLMSGKVIEVKDEFTQPDIPYLTSINNQIDNCNKDIEEINLIVTHLKQIVNLCPLSISQY